MGSSGLIAVAILAKRTAASIISAIGIRFLENGVVNTIIAMFARNRAKYHATHIAQKAMIFIALILA
tara:strand:- start:1366 stop:1566 length:201 start_codon:yes stop_codon:yes gene_type:complete